MGKATFQDYMDMVRAIEYTLGNHYPVCVKQSNRLYKYVNENGRMMSDDEFNAFGNENTYQWLSNEDGARISMMVTSGGMIAVYVMTDVHEILFTDTDEAD